MPQDTTNDDLIVDCCLYFKKQGRIVFAVSADNNLISIAESQGNASFWLHRSILLELLRYTDHQPPKAYIMVVSGPSSGIVRL